jgi:hypothetical protein
MAAPITATTLAEAYDATYTNLHSISESASSPSFYVRLITWRDAFFATLDKDDSNQSAIGYWAVPTSTILSKLPAESLQVTAVQQLLNLIQNTIYSARFDGYTPTPGQETAMVAAFNAAWT